MRRRRQLAFSFIATLAALLALGVGNNNRSTTSQSRAEFEHDLDHSLDGAIDWMSAQIREPNIFVQWMVQDCASLSRDARLQKLLNRISALDHQPFYARMLDERQPLPDPSQYFKMDRQNNYERWLFHSLSRRQYPLSAADQAEMFRPGHRTGRATHQIFALIFYRRFNSDTPELSALMRTVAEGIAEEATLDFRVTDLYLQRIAFLLAAGYPDLVQPRWVERAFANQQSNGGWRFAWHGWHPTPYKFELDDTESSHATAQGLLIGCELKHRYPEWIAAHYR